MKNETVKKYPLIKFLFVIMAGTLDFSFQRINAQSNNFDETVITIVKAFKSRNASVINPYIHPSYKLTVIFRLGVFDEFETTNKINFTKPVPDYLPYPEIVPSLKIKKEKLPKYSCRNEKWNKNGLFCDTAITDHLLSKTATNLKKYRGDKINLEIINNFVKLENISHRVVMVDIRGNDLIFYLSFIENKWYLTILDRVSSDCSV